MRFSAFALALIATAWGAAGTAVPGFGFDATALLDGTPIVVGSGASGPGMYVAAPGSDDFTPKGDGSFMNKVVLSINEGRVVATSALGGNPALHWWTPSTDAFETLDDSGTFCVGTAV